MMRFMAAGTGGGFVSLFDLSTAAHYQRQLKNGTNAPVRGVQFGKDFSSTLAACGQTLFCLDTDSGDMLSEYTRNSEIRDFIQHPVMREIYTCYKDKKVILWDRRDGHAAHTYRHSRPLESITILPSRDVILTGDDNGNIQAWSTKTGRKIHEVVLGSASPVVSMAVMTDERGVFAATSDRTYCCANSELGVLTHVTADYDTHCPVQKCFFHAATWALIISTSDDGRVISFGVDDSPHHWEASVTDVPHTFTACAISSDGSKIYSGFVNGVITVLKRGGGLLQTWHTEIGGGSITSIDLYEKDM